MNLSDWIARGRPENPKARGSEDRGNLLDSVALAVKAQSTGDDPIARLETDAAAISVKLASLKADIAALRSRR
jgi:hypothetical protein